jgi:hypothetical protein
MRIGAAEFEMDDSALVQLYLHLTMVLNLRRASGPFCSDGSISSRVVAGAPFNRLLSSHVFRFADCRPEPGGHDRIDDLSPVLIFDGMDIDRPTLAKLASGTVILDTKTLSL